MQIFISWSGRRSHELAQALSVWLKKVIQSAKPWISSDMERGVKWLAEINKSLDAHSLAIICVTPGNKEAPWLLFETGAMSKHLGDEGRVIPYLLDFKSPSDLKDPLGQFNASLADETGTWQLIETLNRHAEFPQDAAQLKETFDLWWPKLHAQIESIRTSVNTQQPSRRSDSDKLDDVLESVRQLTRSVNQLTGDRFFVDPSDRIMPIAIEEALQLALGPIVGSEPAEFVHIETDSDGGITVFIPEQSYPLGPSLKKLTWDTIHRYVPNIPSGMIRFGEIKTR